MKGLLRAALSLLACARASAAHFDVVLYGASSNLAAKYLLQSLFHLSSALGPGALTVHGVGREALGAWAPRLAALAAANTTCGRAPSARCAAARAAFASGAGALRAASALDLGALGAALNASAARPGWGGRVVYFALASELVPGALRALGGVVDARARTRIVVEKPVGADRAGARALLAELRALLAPDAPPLLVDHFLAKAGVRLAAAARAALAADSAAWRGALGAPALTEALGLEAEDCAGRAAYYSGAGAARDMLLTHLTLAAAAALQSTGAAAPSGAARAGVLAGLRVARDAATGRAAVAGATYAGAAAHGLERAGRVTAAGAVLLARGGARVVVATAKAAGVKSTAVRQTLRLAAGPRAPGAAAEAAARDACGPLTLTLHVQGELLAPSAALAPRVRALGLPAGPPAVLVTGLCGAVRAALGDPRAALARALPAGAGARWEVREDAPAGVWAAAYDARALSPDEALGAAEAARAPRDAAGADALLRALAATPAVSGGDAYTACLAAALVGDRDAFLSAEETDRLWAIWEEAIGALDARAEAGALEEHAHGAPPAWLAPGEAGGTMADEGRDEAGAEAGRAEEL